MDTTTLTETIEKEIYTAISKCLSEDESITLGTNYDFYVPNGVKKLNWEQNTYIDIKYRLMPYSITNIRQDYDLIHPQELIVIVIDDTGWYPSYNTMIPGRNITFLSYEEFNKKIADVVGFDEDFDRSIEKKYIKDNEAKILEDAKRALKNNKVSLFLGAGVSADAGVVTWDSLLQQLCIKKGLPKIDSDIDSVVKGRYIVDEYRRQKDDYPIVFHQDMRKIIYKKTRNSELIKSIVDLTEKVKIESIISYNYDDLVEQEINKRNKKCYSVYDKSRPNDSNSLYIYHVHGYIPKSGECSQIVLGEREYHKIYQESYNWGNVEQLHALSRSTCFFVGLSMTDPNLRRLIDISLDGSDKDPVHYAFLRKIEYNVPFMETIMRGFAVNCIWYEKYEELPVLLRSLL